MPLNAFSQVTWYQLGSSACDSGTLCHDRAQQENRPYYRTVWNGVSKCTLPGQTGQYNYVNCQYRNEDPCVNEDGSWNPSSGTCEIPSPELCDDANQEIFIVDALGGRCAQADQYPGCPAGYMGANVNGVTSCYDPSVIDADDIPPYAIPYVTGNESTPPPKNNVVDNEDNTQTESTESSQREVVVDENGNIIEDNTITTTTETVKHTQTNTSTTTTTVTTHNNLTGTTSTETIISSSGSGGGGSGGGSGDQSSECDSTMDYCGEGIPGIDNYQPSEDLTYESVMENFKNRIDSAEVVTSIENFFSYSGSGGSCPQWSGQIPWGNGSFDFTVDQLCSDIIPWDLIGAIMLAVAILLAAKIALT